MRAFILVLLLTVPVHAATYAIRDGSGNTLNCIVWDGGGASPAGAGQTAEVASPCAITQASPPALTPAQQSAAALAAGLMVSSTGGGWTAAFAANQSAVVKITAQMASLQANGTFTNGQTTRPWLDTSGGVHMLSVAQFKALATASGVWVDALDLYADGAPGAALPGNTATIP